MDRQLREFKGIISDRIFKNFFKNKSALIDFLNSYFVFINSFRTVKDAKTEPQVFIGPNKERI